jgi:aconitate decarboxylase
VAVLFGEGFTLEAVTQGFGNPYRMINPGVAIKRHPSGYFTHRGIDAALELRQAYNINPTKIKSVQIENPVIHYVNRPSPQTGLEGKFSFQYTVASALLDGRISMDTFTDEKLRRPEVQTLLANTQLTMNPDIPANFEEMWTAVRVQMQDGAEYSARCDRPRGIWGHPLTREEHLVKVRSCAARVLPDDDVEALIEIVEDLDQATTQDVQELVEILAHSPAPQAG